MRFQGVEAMCKQETGRAIRRFAALSTAATLTLAVLFFVEPAPAQEKKNMTRAAEKELLDNPARIAARLAAKTLAVNEVPNPHWRPDACRACHTQAAPGKNSAALRDKDTNRLCNVCHEAVSPHSYIHTVGQTPDGAMRARMTKSFREAVARAGGTVTCIGCHDLPMQCDSKRAGEKGLNPLFLREGPYRVRTDLCFRCHDASRYERLNPHDQLTDAGELRRESCLVCHRETPDSKTTGQRLGYNADNLSQLCSGCHRHVPHPGGFSFRGQGQPNHLVAPSARVADRMKDSESRHTLALPLDPANGKVYCGTCHNVHEKGLLTGAMAKGADSKQRLRDPELCSKCHDL
jgi:predicted CXXCH cytochrome family protein